MSLGSEAGTGCTRSWILLMAGPCPFSQHDVFRRAGWPRRPVFVARWFWRGPAGPRRPRLGGVAPETPKGFAPWPVHGHSAPGLPLKGPIGSRALRRLVSANPSRLAPHSADGPRACSADSASPETLWGSRGRSPLSGAPGARGPRLKTQRKCAGGQRSPARKHIGSAPREVPGKDRYPSSRPSSRCTQPIVSFSVTPRRSASWP